MGNKFAAYDKSGNITAFYDDVDSPVPDGINAIQIANDQWQTCLSNQGWTVSKGALVAPSSSVLLAQAQATQLAAGKVAYQSACVQNVSFTSSNKTTKTYQADADSKARLTDAITGCQVTQTTPSGFYWVASDNTQVPFTYADLLGLYAAIFTQGTTAFQRLQIFKSEVNAATTVSAVQAITF